MTDRVAAGQASAAHVLIAPDKFKGSLSARDVAASVARGMQRAGFGVEFDLCPVADGGEGTLDAAVAAGFRRVQVQVEGPVCDPVPAAFGERDGVALVELAEAAGLRHLADSALAPLTASTYGVGQLVDAAITAGNRTVIIAVGGSATSDGGAGLVQALGARLLDIRGKPLGRGGGALSNVGQIDLGPLNSRLDGVKVIIATDVDSPLLGPTGAARIFGPQKGASEEDVAALERGLTRWESVVKVSTGVDAANRAGAGAAGGVGFAAIAMLGAAVVRGADLVLEMVNFPERVHNSLLMITGEGSLDQQSLLGKVPIRAAYAARQAGVPTIAVAGRCTLTEQELVGAGIRSCYQLQTIEPDIGRSMANARSLLEIVGEQIAVAELRQVLHRLS